MRVLPGAEGRPIHAADPAASTDAPPAGAVALPARLQWQVSYDLASVDRYLAGVESERASIERDMERAADRIRRAQEACERRRAAEAELGARIFAAQAELDGIERDQREAVEAILSAAEEEAQRVLAAAQEEAATLRAAAAVAARRLMDGERHRA